MKKLMGIVVPILVLIAAAFAYHLILRGDNSNNTLVVSGTIEVTDAQLSFRIPGMLVRRLVDEGQEVKTGQLIARLDDTDQKLAITKARARLSYSEAALSERTSGSRPQEIADAQAELNKARAEAQTALAQLHQAKAEKDRYHALFIKDVVSAQTYDTFHTRYETAASTYQEAMARVESSRQRLSLRVEGPRAEQIEQARAQVIVDQEALRQAQQQLEYTSLYAPFDGIILSKAAEPGEYLNPGMPVVTIGHLDKVWLRAYVNETDLGRVNRNKEAEVTTDTYPGKTYRGRISFISSEAEFTPKSVQTHEERVKLMYRIKIDLDNPNYELKPGMPADAMIRLGD